jgi:UDP-glucose 4-epimerase
MKLLITGGAGYVGSVVAEFAVAAGHHVVVIDNLQDGHAGAVPPECRLVTADFGNERVLNDVLHEVRFDAVIHLAAEANVATSMTEPAKFFLNNVSRGLTLLEAMRRHRVPRMVFSSTAATYGEPRIVPIPEDHPLAPISAYGESKLMFERCLEWYHRAYGIRAIALRYFNAAGATADRGEDRRDETHLIPLVLSAVQGRRPAIEVFGTDYPTPDGTCVRDYVHVADIARAHLAGLARIDQLGFEQFNVAGESGHSVLQVISEVEAITGRPVPRVFRGRRAGDPAVLIATAAKLRRVLGWRPEQSSLEAIVRSAWEWRLRFPVGYARTAA